MTKDDILRMAREAGLHLYVNSLTEEPYALVVERFANLVAAAEREACADLCEDTHQEYEPFTGQPRALNYTCADAIRARGNK